MKYEIGDYQLNQNITEAKKLIEYSDEEYKQAENSGMKKMFKNEKWFSCEEIDYKDISWIPTLGSIDEKIYKIALQRDFDSEKESKKAFEYVKGVLTKDFGNFSENKDDKLFWDTEFGNILLTKTSIFDFYFVNVFFTSNIINVKFKTENKESTKTISNILLWIAILPLSILSMITVHILNNILIYQEQLWFGSLDVESLSYKFTYFLQEPIIEGFATMFVFVIAGSLIAPKYNEKVALILMVLSCCIACISLYIVNFIQFKYMSNIVLVSGILGAILGYLYIYKKR